MQGWAIPGFAQRYYTDWKILDFLSGHRKGPQPVFDLQRFLPSKALIFQQFLIKAKLSDLHYSAYVETCGTHTFLGSVEWLFSQTVIQTCKKLRPRGHWSQKYFQIVEG